MKYQKSMMKIMETLLKKRRGMPIEEIIKESGTGRSSSFDAMKWLEKSGFIKIENLGNQRIVNLILDDFTLQHKFYLDSIEFKSFKPFIKMVLKILIHNIPILKFRAAVLFGSIFEKQNPKDIDILFLGDNLTPSDLISLSAIKEKIERIFGVILNFHIGDYKEDNLFKGVVFFQNSFFRTFGRIEKQYFEFIECIFDAVKNQNDNKIFKIFFENAKLNLAFAYNLLNGLEPKTKAESLSLFEKKFKIRNIQELKKRGTQIGEKIFI